MERYTLEQTTLAGPKTRVVRFPNFQALERWLDVYGKETHEGSEARSDKNGWSWYGDDTYEKCVEMLRTGWKPPTRFDANKLANQIKTLSGEAERYGIQYDVTGDYIDMGAFMSGRPECWGYTTTETVPVRQINIIVNLGASYATKAETMRRRGIAVAALVDVLRKRHEVKLRAIINLAEDRNMTNSRAEFEIDTKNLYSPDLLYFYLAHPGLFRRIGFRVVEILNKKPSCGGYGYIKEYKPGRDYDPKKDIYFHSLILNKSGRWESDEATAKSMAEIVKRYNETAGAE